MSIPSKKNNNTSSSKPENTVNLPEAAYHKKTIQQFSSFEERDNDRLKYFASLSPEQLLKNLKQLVLSSFGIKNEAELKDAPRIINLKPRS